MKTTIPNDAKVIILGRSAFAGNIGKVTGPSPNRKDMHNVTFKICGRLFENVPFFTNELRRVEARAQR